MNDELNYYLSLGYTEKEAKLICEQTFSRRSYPGWPAPGRMLGRAGMRKESAPMVEAQMMSASANAAFGAGAPVFAEAMAFSGAPAPMSMALEDTGLIENIRSDEYDSFEDNRFKDVRTSPLSTFRTTNNTAAASILLGNYGNYTNTSHDMVRTEELMNFMGFELNSPEADSGKIFEVTSEFRREGDKGFLFLGVQSSKALPKKQNIVLLLDTSGSMSSKAMQLRMAIATVYARMNENDIFSIVTYSDVDHVFIDGMKKNAKHDITYVIDHLKKMEITGCTNGSRGIETAYNIAVANFIEDGINRVIMVTDGDLNFGITQNGELGKFIGDKRDTGVFFSAVGCGLYNLKDDKLEALAKNGNGNYFVVNSIKDAEVVLRNKYESLVYPVAKNVKAQVEFNPAAVSGYRLIGFENRKLEAEDFRDDAVISEPFGSGEKCIACYELKFGAGNTQKLKYSSADGGTQTDDSELCTLTLRYEPLEGGEARELAFPVENRENYTENIARAEKIYDLATTLRSSDDKGLRLRALSALATMAGYKEE